MDTSSLSPAWAVRKPGGTSNGVITTSSHSSLLEPVRESVQGARRRQRLIEEMLGIRPSAGAAIAVRV